MPTLFIYTHIITSNQGQRSAQSQRMDPIGQLIKEELESQERSVAWFARKLCLDRSNVYRLFQKNSIDTSLLARISLILGKDFFSILSEHLQRRRESQQ